MKDWPTTAELDRELGSAVRGDVLEWVTDGVTLRAHVPVRSIDGREAVAGADGARAELRAAAALVERRHAGPEGLRFMRTSIGATLVAFADALGVTERTVRRWESGDVAPDHAVVAAYHRCVLEKRDGNDALAWLRSLDEPGTRAGDVIEVLGI